MYTLNGYYEDDFLIEDLLEDDLLDLEDDFLDEDLLEDDLLEDDILGEDFAERRRRRGRRSRGRRRGINPRYPSGVKRKSNFGKQVSASTSQFVKKSELKSSLDAISKAVNTVKKSTLVNGKALKSLDGKYNDFVKELARKDANQTKVLKNMQTMNMLGSLLNKPKFDESNLQIEHEGGDTIDLSKAKIVEKSDNKTVSFDQTLSLLLPMMTTMGDSKTGKSSSNDMMLPLVLLMTQDKNNDDNNNLLLPLMLMMMNK